MDESTNFTLKDMAIIERIYNRTPYTITVHWGSPSNSLEVDPTQYYEFPAATSLPSSSGSFKVEIAGDGLVHDWAYLWVDSAGHCFSDFEDGTASMPTTNGNMGHHLVLLVYVLIHPDDATREGIVIGDWEVAPHQ